MTKTKTKSEIKIFKDYEGKWTVWNLTTGQCADIYRIEDFGYLASKKPLYRVDLNGKTVESMISDFHQARNIARRHVS